MKCMICGKEVKHNHYSEHSNFFGLCGDTECFNKRFWQLALDDSAVMEKVRWASSRSSKLTHMLSKLNK